MNKEVGTFELPTTIKNITFKMIKSGNTFTIITTIDRNGNVKDFTDQIVVDTSVIVNRINQLLANLDSNQSNNNNNNMSANQLDTIIKLLEKLNLTMEKINNNLEKILANLANKETIGHEIAKETSPIELVTNVEKDNQKEKDIAQDDISLFQDQLDLQDISVNDLLP
jgi:hypothetical protein